MGSKTSRDRRLFELVPQLIGGKHVRKKERAEWMELLAAERHEHRQTTIEFMATIKELTDKIQHPEVHHVETPADYVPPEIPRAFAEMAQVGRDVSDIPDIGNTDRLLAEEKEIAKVGTIQGAADG